MSEPFTGEIRMFGFNFAPRNWAFCNGQLLPISQNSALFSLLGTMYGGDGRTTFGLPNLQSRVPVHQGTGPGLSNRQMGQTGGAETVTLTIPEMPSHTHNVQMMAESRPANSTDPTGTILATGPTAYRSNTPAEDVAMDPNAVRQTSQGGNIGHQNMMPFQVVNFCVAMFGLYPSRS